MKIKKYILLYTIILIGSHFYITSYASAQDERVAVMNHYNDALDHIEKKEYEEALQLLGKLLDDHKEADESIEDIISLAKEQYPKVYFSLGIKYFNNYKKNPSEKTLESAISIFKDIVPVLDKYGLESQKNGILKNMPKLYYTYAKYKYHDKQDQEALNILDGIIKDNPKYASPYHLKALVLKRMKKPLKDVLDNFDLSIKYGSPQTVAKSKEAAYGNVLYAAVNYIEQGKFNEAQPLLNRALTYDDTSPDVYYRMAELANKKKEYKKSVEYAKKSLDYEKRGKNEKSKIYYELGIAYKHLNNPKEACEAFSKVAPGNHRSSADHEMEHELKCNEKS